jgi:hypothetical protein
MGTGISEQSGRSLQLTTSVISAKVQNVYIPTSTPHGALFWHRSTDSVGHRRNILYIFTTESKSKGHDTLVFTSYTTDDK